VGSGGDAPGVEEQFARAKQPASPAKEKKSEARERDRDVAMDNSAPDALDGRSKAVPPAKAAPPPPAASVQGGSVAASSGTLQSSLPAQAPMPSAQAERQVTPASLEAGAQDARHAANYLKAASLYREAATLRRRENDPSAAAWNLAHAVECLAAIGRFDEARQVRDELVRLFPAETGPQSAARRVLREVEPPPVAH
jgi:tetratricopeptide (TPR) repeat protein